MEIIDAQIHNPHSVAELQLGGNSELESQLSAEIALSAMGAVGVDAAIFHHPTPLTLAELESQAVPAVIAPRLYPGRFGGVITPDPTRVTDIDTMLAQVRARFRLLAIRMTPSWPVTGGNDIPRVQQGGFDDWFAAAQRHEVPICMFIPGHLRELARIAARFPGLTLIVDHLGMYPPPRVPLAENSLDALPELVALARFPNVAVKFTGVAALSPAPYPFADLWPRLHPVLEAFSPSRLMWGSDFTRVATLHSYSEAVNFLRYTNEVSNSDKEAMFATSARRWFRWPHP